MKSGVKKYWALAAAVGIYPAVALAIAVGTELGENLAIDPEIENMNERSFAANLDGKETFNKSAEGLKEKVEDINHEIIDGSGWLKSNRYLSAYSNNRQSFVDAFNVSTVLDSGAENASFTLIGSGEESVLRLDSDDSVDIAATKGASLLKAAYETAKGASKTVNPGVAYGVYQLEDNGQVTFTPQKNAPKTMPRFNSQYEMN